MRTKEIRPVVSSKTYDDVISAINLPVVVGFDKSLRILIERYHHYEKYFHNFQGVDQ